MNGVAVSLEVLGQVIANKDQRIAELEQQIDFLQKALADKPAPDEATE